MPLLKYNDFDLREEKEGRGGDKAGEELRAYDSEFMNSCHQLIDKYKKKRVIIISNLVCSINNASCSIVFSEVPNPRPAPVWAILPCSPIIIN